MKDQVEEPGLLLLTIATICNHKDLKQWKDNFELLKNENVEKTMEEKPRVNEKTLFQIVIRVTLGWMYFSFMIALLFNLYSDPTPIRSALITAVFIGAFEIPFGIIGGYIGKVWRKTQRATRNGVILGTLLASLSIGFFFLLMLGA
ncbi:MAG TPA: hypothetical protein VJ987_02225 [Anaerolineales bacterium]|nr:hypothetical protein [Anaerolineales bacterium]